jgi:hypothetical protein
MNSTMAEPTADDEILDVWKARQESLRSLEVRVSGIVRRPHIRHGQIEYDIVLRIQGSDGDLRFDSTRREMSANGRVAKTSREIVASNRDGTVRRLTYDEEKAVPEGTVDYDHRYTPLSEFITMPVYLACRFGMLPYKSPYFHHTVSDDSSGDGNLRLDYFPLPCLTGEQPDITLASPFPSVSFFIDSAASCINRMTSSDANQRPMRKLVIHYDEQGREPWFPSSWEASIIDPEGKTTEHYLMKVIECAINPSITPEVFELRYPANAIVFHNKPPNGYYTRALANGEFERISTAEAGAALEASHKRRHYTLPVESRGFLHRVPLLATLGGICLISLGSLGASLVGLCSIRFSSSPRRRMAIFLGAVSVVVGIGMAGVLYRGPLGLATWASLSGMCIVIGTLTIFAAMSRRSQTARRA